MSNIGPPARDDDTAVKHWSRLNLGAADLADTALADVCLATRAHWHAAGCPEDLAVFSRHESEGRLHCELIVYFSPAATDLAQQLGAAPCAPPGPHDLAALAGGELAGDAAGWYRAHGQQAPP